MENSPRRPIQRATARLKTRLAAVEAFRRAAQHYESFNDQSYGYADAASRQNSLIRRLSDTMVSKGDSAAAPFEEAHAAASTASSMPITAAEEAFSKRVALVPRGMVRRGLLADPPPFTRTTRGVAVRGGGHVGRNQYAELKTADLRTAYALYLLETDLNHYRHLYFENERKQHVEGRLKYFYAPSCKGLVPTLWLEEPWTVVENLQRASSDDSIAAELENLPALRQRFATVRRQEIARVRTKARPQRGDLSDSSATEAALGKRPAGLLPGKGTVMALKVATEQRVKAASVPPRPPAPVKAPL